MFDYYDHVNAAAVWVPWVLAGLFLFLWAVQIRAYRNQGEDLGKAEAEARELKTTLDENERKWQEKWAIYYPNPILSTPAVLGNPAKKGGKGKKRTVTKKIVKSLAKPKKRA